MRAGSKEEDFADVLGDGDCFASLVADKFWVIFEFSLFEQLNRNNNKFVYI